MKYIITKQNIVVTIDNEPHIIGNEDRRFNKVKEALENFQPDYMIREIISPSEDVETAKEMLNGIFKEEA